MLINDPLDGQTLTLGDHFQDLATLYEAIVKFGVAITGLHRPRKHGPQADEVPG
jgi:hypothetical protein